MIIAFDGYSGTGKSTLAKLVAKKLNYYFLNTGMIYRGLTAYLLDNNIKPEDCDKNEDFILNTNIRVEFNNYEQRIIINNEDYTLKVSDKDVQKNVSVFSSNAIIRKKILITQHEVASDNNICVEGRDIGTEVFPNAEYKFFVVCDVDIRAKRRHLDLINLGQNITVEEVKESLKQRDYLDETRELSPLKKAKDAIEINTSYKNIDECIKEVLNIIKK